MIVPKKAATAVTRCNKIMQYNRHARRFSIASLPRPSRSSSSAPTYSRSEELSRALSTQLSSNEGEQPVCHSRLIDNRKIEIFKAPALSGAFAYSHLSGALLVVGNASAMSPIAQRGHVANHPRSDNVRHDQRQNSASFGSCANCETEAPLRNRCWSRIP
jgi:hypothetical protein